MTEKHDDCIEIQWQTGPIPEIQEGHELIVDPQTGEPPTAYEASAQGAWRAGQGHLEPGDHSDKIRWALTSPDGCTEPRWQTGPIPRPEMHTILTVDQEDGNTLKMVWQRGDGGRHLWQKRVGNTTHVLHEGDVIECRWSLEDAEQKRDEIYNADERAAMIGKMKQVSGAFYPLACRTGCHAFIEFTGMMNEYIKLCEAAHEQGIDFNTTNVHLGKSLPMKEYMAKYLGEKLGCIYGTSLSDPELFMAFVNELELPFEVNLAERGPVSVKPYPRKAPPIADTMRLLIQQAQERFDALSPEGQRQHRKDQARSFVKGNLELSGIKFDEQAFEDAYERNHN